MLLSLNITLHINCFYTFTDVVMQDNYWFIHPELRFQKQYCHLATVSI